MSDFSGKTIILDRTGPPDKTVAVCSEGCCPECGTPLAMQDTGGVCSKCLLSLGLATQLAEGTLPAVARGLRGDGVINEPFDFGEFRVLRFLGRGGMGAAYEAEETATGRRVAIKVLGHTLDSPEMRERFLHEGQVAASLRHENTVAVLSAGEISGTPVIAMELLHGGTLKDRVKERGPLPVAEAVDAMLHVIDGLEAAHAGGVLHRDVKPANCFTASDGTVKIGDFGLSVSALTAGTAGGTAAASQVMGTPAFASPEQLRCAETDLRSDIYSAGATLYYLLTGRPAHDGASLAQLLTAVAEQVPARPESLRRGIPPQLGDVVLRCMEKEPSDRFADYAALRAALQPFSSSGPAPAPRGLRLMAWTADWVLLTILKVGLLVPLLTRQGWHEEWQTLAVYGMFFLWFWLSEWLRGASPGKQFCHLSVQAPGGPRSAGRMALRALLAEGPWLAGWALGWLQAMAMHYWGGDSRTPVIEIAGGLHRTMFYPEVITLVLIAVCYRERTRWALWHDLLTGTRVCVAPQHVRRMRVGRHSAEEKRHRPAVASPPADSQAAASPAAASPAAASPAAEPGRGERLGPYLVHSREGDWLTGEDPVLQRGVWLRQCSGTPLPPPARLHLSRPGRLRWLAGRRSETECWDAWEALPGQPLTGFPAGSQPWSAVRQWLADVVTELNAAAADGTLPPHAGAAHVWITDAGRAVLCESPVPGAETSTAHSLETAKGQQAFLTEIADRTEARLPVSAREFVKLLRRGKAGSLSSISAQLQLLNSRAPQVEARTRLVPLAAMCAAIISLPMLGMVLHPDRPAAQPPPEIAATEGATVSGDKPDTSNPAWEELLKAAEAAGATGKSETDSANAATPPQPRTWLGKLTSGDWVDTRWLRAATANLGPARLLADAGLLLSRVPRTSPIPPRSGSGTAPAGTFQPVSQEPAAEPFSVSLVMLTLNFCGIYCIGGLLLSIALGGPALARLAGATPVLRDGQPAPRWRVALRGICTSVLVLGACALPMLLPLENWSAAVSAALVSGSHLLLAAAAIWWTSRWPDRSLADRFAGTWLVPR